MQLFSWLHKRVTARKHTKYSPARGPARRFRPQLEVLEGRDVPSTLTVTNNLDSGPGSLRAEIAAAQNNDTIVFAPSLNDQTITLTNGGLNVNKSLTIQGPGAGQLTVTCYPAGSWRVFDVNANQPVVVSGLTIVHGGILNDTALTISGCFIYGCGATYGGAIDNLGTLTVNGCNILRNSALSGAGIYNNLGTLTVSNSTIGANRANNVGGGIYNTGTLTMSQSTLSGNWALSGGGIYNTTNRGKATLTDCTVNDNTAAGVSDPWGGAVYGGGGLFVTVLSTATLTNCTFSNNTASHWYGGALFADARTTVTLTNCTLDGDSAGQGGAVYNSGTLTVTGSTLSFDSAYNHGGGIDNAGALTVLDSIFSSDTPDDIYGAFTDGGGNTFN